VTRKQPAPQSKGTRSVKPLVSKSATPSKQGTLVAENWRQLAQELLKHNQHVVTKLKADAKEAQRAKLTAARREVVKEVYVRQASEDNRGLTADQVYGFTRSLLMSGFDNPQPTPELHIEMWEKCCSSSQFVAFAAPRGHAKSTSITHSYTLAEVLFRNAQFVLLVSDTEGQAVMFLGDIKNELLGNDNLRSLFGIKRFIKDTETDIIVEMDDGHQFRIIAKGSLQKVRGIKWRGKRPDLIIGDDLENDDLVMNEERRDKFRRWVNNALLPALSDDGRCRIVGTILHLDSFLERCMPDFEKKDTTHTDGIRWWSSEPDNVWDSVRYQGHNDDFTQLLWPEKFSEARYRAIRKRYVDDGNPEGYSQEYLNYPIDEATAYFQKQDFREWDERDEYMEYYIGGDLAISEKDKRAFTVFVVAGLTRENKIVVVDVRRFRGNSLEIVDSLFDLQTRYSPELIFLESENIEKSIGPFVDQEMLRRGVFMNIVKENPTKDKTQRARALQARMKAGGVYFDKEADWWPALFNEMVTFPRGKYMDQVDALSWIGLGLNKLVPTYTTRQIADFEWDEEYGDTTDPYANGACETTGY
jgi:predicted phage terminase large subunit-like protein